MSVFPHGGVVSDGTMRAEDLLPRFVDVARRVSGKRYVSAEPVDDLLDAIELRASRPGYFDSESCGWDMEDLFELLDELCPEGWWFGASEGDGACYGFWRCEEEGG